MVDRATPRVLVPLNPYLEAAWRRPASNTSKQGRLGRVYAQLTELGLVPYASEHAGASATPAPNTPALSCPGSFLAESASVQKESL
jgi:hypothetical protein